MGWLSYLKQYIPNLGWLLIWLYNAIYIYNYVILYIYTFQNGKNPVQKSMEGNDGTGAVSPRSTQFYADYTCQSQSKSWFLTIIIVAMFYTHNWHHHEPSWGIIIFNHHGTTVGPIFTTAGMAFSFSRSGKLSRIGDAATAGRFSMGIWAKKDQLPKTHGFPPASFGL